MKGTILANGLILGADEKRYSFDAAENKNGAKIGDQVDFVASESAASEIYAINTPASASANSAKSSGRASVIGLCAGVCFLSGFLSAAGSLLSICAHWNFAQLSGCNSIKSAWIKTILVLVGSTVLTILFSLLAAAAPLFGMFLLGLVCIFAPAAMLYFLMRIDADLAYYSGVRAFITSANLRIWALRALPLVLLFYIIGWCFFPFYATIGFGMAMLGIAGFIAAICAILCLIAICCKTVAWASIDEIKQASESASAGYLPTLMDVITFKSVKFQG